MKLYLWRLWVTAVFILVAADVSAQSSVWMLKGKNATVYLAGSIHLLRPTDHPLPAEFFRAYENSHKIVFEVLPGEMERPENAERYLRVSVYPDNATLREHLPADIYAAAEGFCRERNHPLNQLVYLRPGFFLITLTVLEMNKLGADWKKGVDYIFKEKAFQDGKAIGALETAAEQIQFLSALDTALEPKQLAASLEELRMTEKHYTRTLLVWRKGDEKQLTRLYAEKLKGYPSAYQTIIAERNKRWLKTIEAFLEQEGNTMVIAGLVHFAGEEGLLNLLRQRGHQIIKLRKK